MPTTSAGYSSGVPGYTAARTTTENSVLYQSFFLGDVVYAPAAVIDSTAVDAGNSPTSLLRPGLVMGQLAASGEWVDYDEDAVDGSQIARGVLVNEIYLLDYTAAAAADRAGNVIVVSGKAMSSRLIANGGGIGSLTLLARRQLASFGFTFDDAFTYPNVDIGFITVETVSDGAETLTAADHGKLFVADTQATTFTLPALATNIGFVAEFLNNVDANMAVVSAENNNILVDGDLLAGTLTFSTGSHKIGSRCRLEARYVGTTAYWLFTNLGGTTVTPT